MRFNFLARLRIISIALLFFGLVLVGKLYLLQVVHSDTYRDKADRQYLSAGGNVFNRGTIFFQNKDGSLVSAATLKSGTIIAVNPQVLKNPEDVYQKINPILPMDHDAFIAKATKKNDPYEELAKHVDTTVGEQISELKIPGLNVYKDRWRFYPGGETAAQTIGILGFKGDEYAGRYGLERQYENVLARSNEAYVNFFAEIFSNIKTIAGSNGTEEGDIVTTIEPTVESYLENQLASTTAKWSSQMTGGIIMNPKTGEIYAMGTYPTFDPNNPQNDKGVDVFSNPLVQNVYEMGSVIKPLTMAAGIDAGVVTASSTYYDTGSITLNGKKISNFDGKARGTTDMQQVLSQSLNLGVAYVTKLLGNERFTNYMYGFGLNEKTGIDLPSEARPLADNLKSPRDLEHATASFGQGIALTPIATARALATIANGGYLVEPHLVKKTNYKIGLSVDAPIEKSAPVIKPSTAAEVARMMVYSTDHTLSNGTLSLPNYSVAVKTGTAQIAKSGGGGYSEDEFLHSFVGFFPAYDPQFLIFLYTVNPKGARFGSETLSVPFMDTVKFLINYYEVPPDR